MSKVSKKLKIVSAILSFGLLFTSHAKAYTNNSYTLGNWRLETDGTDSSTNGNNGTANNVTFSSANGHIGQGAGFAGNSSINIINDYNTSSAKTISCWIKLGSSSQSAIIFGGFANYFLGQYGKGIVYDSGNIFAVGQQASNHAWIGSPLTDTSSWHNITAEFDTAGKLYIDGSVTATGDISDHWSYSWNFGQTQEALKGFTGAIDDCEVESRLWSDTQVANYIRVLSKNTQKYSFSFFLKSQHWSATSNGLYTPAGMGWTFKLDAIYCFAFSFASFSLTA